MATPSHRETVKRDCSSAVGSGHLPGLGALLSGASAANWSKCSRCHQGRGSWICCPVGESGGMGQVQPEEEKALQALGSTLLRLSRRLRRWWSPALHNGELKEGKRGHKPKQDRFRTERRRRKVFTMKRVSSQTGCSEWLHSLRPLRFSRPDWQKFWAACCDFTVDPAWSKLKERLPELPSSFNNHMILLLCET